MDKDLLKLYAEYEKYNTELPWLRNEYNFLVEGIEAKKKESEDLTKKNEQIKKDNAWVYLQIEKDKKKAQDDIDNMRTEAKKSLDKELAQEKKEI